MQWQIVERYGSGLNDKQKQAFFPPLDSICRCVCYVCQKEAELRHALFSQAVQQLFSSKFDGFHLIKKEEVCKLVEEMLHNDVIKPSTSPRASSVVLIHKKDRSTRMCIDYRKPNAVTRKDAYPLPRIDDALDALSGSKWFSTLDLISGYWQVEKGKTDQ